MALVAGTFIAHARVRNYAMPEPENRTRRALNDLSFTLVATAILVNALCRLSLK